MILQHVLFIMRIIQSNLLGNFPPWISSLRCVPCDLFRSTNQQAESEIHYPTKIVLSLKKLSMIKRHLNSTLLALILGELTTEGSIHGTGLWSESQNQGIHRESGVDGGINLEKLTPFACFLPFFGLLSFSTRWIYTHCNKFQPCIVK